MRSRVTDRLSAARPRQFVGRNGERNVFQAVLSPGELPLQVLHVFGPGGVGKTSLLGEFASISDELESGAICLDGRAIDVAPESFLLALVNAINLSPNDSPIRTLAKLPGHPGPARGYV